MDEIKGRVSIPSTYFLEMAKHDYESYRHALAREFYQNSIDAGSKNIHVTTDSESSTITVKDDGCGMNFDVLQNKLLVLGGSHKAEGAVGAFGKAKEILFFSWDSYSIRTGTHLVEGRGAEYTITTVPPVKGTECVIRVQDDENFNFLANKFEEVAERMQTKTKIFVNNDYIKCTHKRGKLVMVVPDVGNIHQVKSRSTVFMQVRINGIWMFSKYVGDGLGKLILELSGQSTDVLTSNRDSFKWDTNSKMSSLVQDLMINKASALQSNTPTIRQSISGTGKITVGEQVITRAKTVFNRSGDVKQVLREIITDLEDLSAIQKARISNAPKIKENEWDDFVDEIKFIGYEPDFVLLHYEGQDKTSFLASKKARLLANMWTEIVKQVLIDYKKYLEFTVGFTFDKNAEASIHRDGSEVTIYLNPDKVSTSGHRKILMETLKDLAIHEIAHLSHGNHDGDFVDEMAEIRKSTYINDRTYYAIQRTKVK